MKDTSPTTRWLIQSAAALVLLAMLLIGGISLPYHPGKDAYFARVREAIQDIEYRIGPWNGTDVDENQITPAALDLLRPNIIFQRTYVIDMNRSVSLLIVHCGRVRDMDGHYPPICYKGQGWAIGTPRDRTIEVGGMSIPARDYPFTKSHDGIDRSLLVTGFFILPVPGQPVYREMKAVERASRSPRANGLGSAQVQLVSYDEFTEAEWNEMLQLFGTELAGVIEVIGGGTDGS